MLLREIGVITGKSDNEIGIRDSDIGEPIAWGKDKIIVGDIQSSKIDTIKILFKIGDDIESIAGTIFEATVIKDIFSLAAGEFISTSAAV